jgi:hypothetical protein
MNEEAILRRWAYLAFLTYKAPISYLLTTEFDADLAAAADAYEKAFHSQEQGDATKTFCCAGCGFDVPWSMGAADDTPDLCDDCAAKQTDDLAHD